MDNQNHAKNSSLSEDEIDLREILITLWRGKLLITLCVLVAIIFAAAFLRIAERKYINLCVFSSSV